MTIGCFNERSFPFVQDRLVRLEPSRSNVRAWLETTHRHLAARLPESSYPALLTDDLTRPDGSAANVLDHFDKNPRLLHTAWFNLDGLTHTAQVTGDTEAVEIPAPDWPGFEEVWVDVAPGVSISGRLGLATRDGVPLAADCIVILPGLLGDNMRVRTRDICAGLRDAGFHAMSVEFRGHGQVERRFPQTPYNFGVLETSDLLAVADWLQSKPYVRRTGLIGFSWSANVALLTAWEEGRRTDDPMVTAELAGHLPAHDRSKRRYQAGILALSPTLDFETLLDKLETPRAYLINPCLSSIQSTVARRIARKNHGPKTGSLRKLIEYEFAKSRLNYPEAVADGLTYLRLLPYKELPYRPKLDDARMPVIIVHGANDPFAHAQEVADFFADTHNPNVAGIILPGGGHDGFAAYAADYLYSLFINFFDPRRGPVSEPRS